MSAMEFRWYKTFMGWLWKGVPGELHGSERWLKLTIRMLFVLVRDLLDSELSLRATGLVYTTLLSVVPLLAVSFSVLKGFGVHNELQPLLDNFLAPLGQEGRNLSASIILFVENVKVGVLGSVGLVFLLYTVVTLTQKVESSFNYVWQVECLRALARRIPSYLSVILVGPVLVFAALGLTATIMDNSLVKGMMSVEPLGWLIVSGSRLAPYLLVIAAFTLAYALIPNTRVRLLPALAGGIIAGVLWQTSGWGFAAFIASSSRYAAIYSGFAILILLLLWLYLNWLILLLGAQISFYIQYPQYMTRHPVHLSLSNRLREYLALQLMFVIADRHMHGRDPATLEELIQHVGLPTRPVYHVLRVLEAAGFVSETSDEPPAYLPRRDIETIHLSELLGVMRSADEDRLLLLHRLPYQTEVDAVLEALQLSMERELGKRTLRDMIVSGQTRHKDADG